MAGLTPMNSVATIATRNHINWEQKYTHVATTAAHYTSSYLFPAGSINLISARITLTEALNTMRSQFWDLRFAWKISKDGAFSTVCGAGITTVATAYDFDVPYTRPILASVSNGFRIGCVGDDANILYYHVIVNAQTMIIS